MIENIDYNKLNIETKTYNNYQAKNIIFCEGAAVVNNSFIKQKFLNLAKGQLLCGKSSSVLPKIIYNGKIYIIPTTENEFICGATYEWDYINNEPDEFGKNYLIEELNKVVRFEYTISDHKAAIRPTVIDRKPVVGNIADNIYILNGLGTKGVVLAPYLANLITENITNSSEISKEFSIDRFNNK